MPDMEPGEVWIAPLDSDPSDSDTWRPVGTLAESVEHEPADTTPLNLAAFGPITAQIKGGTVSLPAAAPEPPRKRRVRLDLPGREPRYGTLDPASVDYDPDTGTAHVAVTLDPLPLDVALARAWADDLFGTVEDNPDRGGPTPDMVIPPGQCPGTWLRNNLLRGDDS